MPSNPVMLYSIGKDSAVMLHLARKAFYPAPPPFPLLHVDTTWKFRDDVSRSATRMARELGLRADRPPATPRRRRCGINPFDHGSRVHTDMWKTEGLKQALDKYGFDAAFGGARRDEEKSPRQGAHLLASAPRQHRWDPKNQRPELWRLYNARKQPGREHPRVPAVELDRARHLAVHLPGGHPDRAALFRRASGRWSSATAR